MPQSRSELTRYGLPLWAAAFVGLACVALIGLSAWHQWIARQNDLKEAEVDLANMTRSLTQHADDTFELADNLVTTIVTRIENGGGPGTIAKVHQFLQMPRNDSRTPGIVVLDETGRWVATSEKLDMTGRNNSDREYFQHHKASRSRDIYIGHPVKGRTDGEWTVTVSHRIDHPDGSFAGVVVASINIDYFVRYYRQFNVGKGGVITLFTRDGIILARSQDNDDLIGSDLSNSTVFRQRASGSVFYYRAASDDIERLSVYQESQRYPLVLVSTMAKQEVLASWWRETLIQIFFVSSIAVFIALMGVHLVRRLMERQRMATALAAKEADFRLLAEQCSDVVMRIGADEEIVYASPSCISILGSAPERLQGTSALSGVHEDDLVRARETVAALMNGEISEGRMVYRKRHATKDIIWLETALRATRNSQTGAIDGVVAICRDVTEQKNIEQKLDTMARSDALTGLANRRQFDETLADEWARAKRDNTELGLLLLDVDHFKRYNDSYGHQAGDDCLRTVALVIANQAQRPADLAARYGGEEFALLLPNTDSEGCQQVAANIRNTLHGLDIEHDGNEPFRCVTITIGGAATRPAAASARASELVEAADAALYFAKNSGRNAVRIAGQINLADTTTRRRA